MADHGDEPEREPADELDHDEDELDDDEDELDDDDELADDEPDDDDALSDLSFDRVETAEGASSSPCAQCSAAIAGEYWEGDGRLLCGPCVSRFRHGEPGDSAPGRALRATGLGFAAAVVSALVWWGIREATGFEIGLIAIAVGLAVGFGVRIGSKARGGWFYQAPAMALTYLSIVSTYVPPIVHELRSAATEEVTESDGVPVAREAAPDDIPLGVHIVVACVIAPFAPFLMGFENIIGLALIAFALWEAWRVNKRPVKKIVGPFRLAGADAPPAS